MQTGTKVQFLYSVGGILMTLGALFAGGFSTIFDSLLEKQLILAPGSESLEKFTQSPVPITMEYYFFNVTNPEDVQFEGAKPILQEIGPYTYIKYDVKEGISFLSGTGTLEYKHKETYFFDAKNSVGNEDDNITTVNPILVVLGSKMNSMNPVFQNLGGWLFMGFDSLHDLFITKTVGELLFEGYHDSLVEFLGSVTNNPKHIEGKFAFFHEVNNSYVGNYKVNTGENGIDEHLFITERNGEKQLDFFDDPYCNMINGTDAKQFPPHVTKKTVLTMYSETICRSMTMVYQKEFNLHGLKTYVFAPSEDFYSTSNPDNECFCKNKWYCTQGIMDISSCKEGAPVLMSGPHFLNVNSTMLDRVEGLSPNQEKHGTAVYIEPITGLVVKAAKRLQVNFPIKRYDGLAAFDYVSEFVLPVFWAFEGATAPPHLAQKIKDMTTKPFVFAYIASGTLVMIGLIVILTGLWKSRNVRKDEKGEYHKQEKY